MSTNTALDQIKSRVEGHTEGPWRVWAEAPRKDGLSIETSWARPGEETELVADCYKAPDVELIAAAPKLLAALEVIQYVAAQHAARTPFPDADKESQWYSLGKQHAYERVLFEIEEALR